MSHFYATIKGARGEATRCGSKGSGHHAKVAGWGGAIEVMLTHDEKAGKDKFAVWIIPWGSKGGRAILLATGVLDIDTVREEGFVMDTDMLHTLVEKQARRYMTEGT